MLNGTRAKTQVFLCLGPEMLKFYSETFNLILSVIGMKNKRNFGNPHWVSSEIPNKQIVYLCMVVKEHDLERRRTSGCCAQTSNPSTRFVAARPRQNPKCTLTFKPVANSTEHAMSRGSTYKRASSII